MENRLKFKVWDNVNKCWADLTGLAIDCQTGELCCSWVDALYVNNECRDAKDFTIVRFTGLLDKAGVEIYEGDILPALHTTGSVIVVYDAGLASFELQDRADDSYSYSEHLLDLSGENDLGYNPWEVLGNIWEQPELVK